MPDWRRYRQSNSLLDDRSDDACTDGTATFTDSEAELLFHCDRDDQR
ncbi:hypothetical protein CEV33_0291, partial [Brucella grignonensis]